MSYRTAGYLFLVMGLVLALISIFLMGDWSRVVQVAGTITGFLIVLMSCSMLMEGEPGDKKAA